MLSKKMDCSKDIFGAIIVCTLLMEVIRKTKFHQKNRFMISIDGLTIERLHRQDRLY